MRSSASPSRRASARSIRMAISGRARTMASKVEPSRTSEQGVLGHGGGGGARAPRQQGHLPQHLTWTQGGEDRLAGGGATGDHHLPALHHVHLRPGLTLPEQHRPARRLAAVALQDLVVRRHGRCPRDRHRLPVTEGVRQVADGAPRCQTRAARAGQPGRRQKLHSAVAVVYRDGGRNRCASSLYLFAAALLWALAAEGPPLADAASARAPAAGPAAQPPARPSLAAYR